MTAIRTALPVWRTTPNIVLHRDSGILPAEVLLQQKQLRNTARIRRFDNYHPLATRANETPKDAIKRLKLREGQNERVFRVPERYVTRLQNANHTLPVSEAPGDLRQPSNARITVRAKCDKKEKAKQIQIWLRNLLLRDRPVRIVLAAPEHDLVIIHEADVAMPARLALPRPIMTRLMC